MIKEAYEAGVQKALEDAGLIKTAGEENAGKGFWGGAVAGASVPVAAILAEIVSRGKFKVPEVLLGQGGKYAPALMGGGIGAGIGSLIED